MAQLVTMPQLGSTMEEGLIVRWHKQEGEIVRKGETLLEIETDKATMEVECPCDGTLHKILVTADASVPIQTPIAILGEQDEEIAYLLAELGMGAAVGSSTVAATAANGSAAASEGAPKGVATPVSEPPASDQAVFLSPRARRVAEAEGVAAAELAGRGTGPDGRVLERDVAAYLQERKTLQAVSIGVKQGAEEMPGRLSPRVTPLAARMADDLGVDLGALATGLPGSRVRSEDVLRHAQVSQPAAETPAVTPDAEFTVQVYSGMRKRIGDNVARSAFTAPHVTLTLEVDMTACAELRASLLPEIEKRYEARLSYTDILVKAVARTLEEHPRLNACLVGDEIRTYAHKNIGIAVALDEGLVVPVLKKTESKSLGAICAELKPLIERARTGKFSPDDVSGGTFSITNLGTFGIDVFDPIIVTGQAAILGVGRIADKPVVVNKELAVRTMMNLCLSFDHRLVDGVPAARFLQRLKALLEAPLLILI